MGFLCQKSCYLVPDVEFLKAKNDAKVAKRTARKQDAKEKAKHDAELGAKLEAELEARSEADSDTEPDPELEATLNEDLVKRRHRQFEDILEETRVWMYGLLVPTETIANGDVAIKRELDIANRKLRERLLGTHIVQSKIDAVCGKIARNILISSTGNLEPGRPSYPPVPAAERRKHLLDHKYIKASILELIHEHNPDFRANHPSVRTWHEVRQVAGPYEVHGKPLLEYLDRWQEEMTWMELGLPHAVNWRTEAEARIHDCMESSNPNSIGHFSFEHDLILARSGNAPSMPTFMAELNFLNIMSLHRGFYDPKYPDGISGLQITPGKDNIREIDTRILTILHELTHSDDVLDTKDHEIEYREPGFDFISGAYRYRARGEPYLYKAYRLESCLGLVRRDDLNDTNYAEDNADSWALYFCYRILMLTYPELDIIGALDTPNIKAQPTRIPNRRDGLLHHCTLFYPLRHRDADDYRVTNTAVSRLGDYDPTKDHWSQQAHQLDGRQISHSVKDILEIAKALDDRRIDEEDPAMTDAKKPEEQNLRIRSRDSIASCGQHNSPQNTNAMAKPEPFEASEVSIEDRLSTEEDYFQNGIDLFSIKLSTLSDERRALEQEADQTLSEDSACEITKIDVLKRLLKALRTELNMIGTARGCLGQIWGQAGGSISTALASYQAQLTRDETAIQAASEGRSVQLKELVEEVGEEVVMELFGDGEDQKLPRTRRPSIDSEDEE